MADYKDCSLSPKERAKALLAKMSLEEKFGQIIGFYPSCSEEFETLSEKHPYSVGGVSTMNILPREASLLDRADMLKKVQEEVMKCSPHHIPAILHLEGLCGALLDEGTSFPSGMARASTWNPKLEYEVGKLVGEQERAIGITQTFAPVLDIARDPRMGRYAESYGEDPTLASAMGAAYTRGIQENSEEGLHTGAVGKHFLGFHAGIGGIHGIECDISQRQLREIYAKTFQAAITEAGLRGIMPCYNVLNGSVVSGSKDILTDLLRNEMGFEGVTVSDYSALSNMHHVQRMGESPADTGRMGLEAGLDMELPQQHCYNEKLAEMVKNGKVDEKYLNQAVLRILEEKFRMGLFEHPFAESEERIKSAYDNPKNRKLSYQAAVESFVLLKNDGILPINKNYKKIVVVGESADDASVLFGGYTTYAMQEMSIDLDSATMALRDASEEKAETYPGTKVRKRNDHYKALLKKLGHGAKGILTALTEAMPDTEIIYKQAYPMCGNDMSMHEEALSACEDADLVIAVVGSKYGFGKASTTGEGLDTTDINLAESQEVFLKKIGKMGKKIAAVHFGGRVISSDAADEYCNAILQVWTPAECGGEAIADVLTGKANPGGKLTVSVPRNAGQIPVYYNHGNGSHWHQPFSIGFADYVNMSHHPRYHFGDGLSYTTFEYSNLKVKENAIAADGKLEFSFDIKNAGDVAGAEIAQVYTEDIHASRVRPYMELRGFCKVFLEPGEKKSIQFSIPLSQMAFLDNDMAWKVEGGAMKLHVGSSSANLIFTENFTILGDQFVDGKVRGFYTIGKVEE